MSAPRADAAPVMFGGSAAYRHRGAASAISIALHAAMIVVLVLITARPNRAPVELDRDRMTILDLAARPTPPPPPVQAAPPSIDKPRGFQTLTAPLETPTSIPPPAETAFDAADFSGRGVEGGVAKGVADTVAAERPSYYELSDVSVMPRMTRVVKPEYPFELVPDLIRGTVLVQAVLLEKGTVDPATCRVIKSLHPLLDEAARRALLRSQFSPAQFQGQAVKVEIIVPYVFNVKGG